MKAHPGLYLNSMFKEVVNFIAIYTTSLQVLRIIPIPHYTLGNLHIIKVVNYSGSIHSPKSGHAPDDGSTSYKPASARLTAVWSRMNRPWTGLKPVLTDHCFCYNARLPVAF